jgi:hypothetical protein
MPATIGIGKDQTISGIVNTKVRSVTITSDGPQIDCTKRGDAVRKYLTGFQDQTIEVECLEDPGLTVGGATPIQVTAGHATGYFYVMSVNKTEPLDDVVTWKVSLKRTNAPTSGGGGA